MVIWSVLFDPLFQSKSNIKGRRKRFNFICRGNSTRNDESVMSQRWIDQTPKRLSGCHWLSISGVVLRCKRKYLKKFNGKQQKLLFESATLWGWKECCCCCCRRWVVVHQFYVAEEVYWSAIIAIYCTGVLQGPSWPSEQTKGGLEQMDGEVLMMSRCWNIDHSNKIAIRSFEMRTRFIRQQQFCLFYSLIFL